MTTLIIVHRYDNPDDRYGIHSNAPNGTLREGVFWPVGLFSKNAAATKLSEPEFRNINVEVHPEEYDLEKLINCAPIEWHSAMRNGEMLDRFTVFTTPQE